MAYVKQKPFRVGVFPQRMKTKTRYNAYTRDYNTQWANCCEHEVMAEFGWEAKEKAITEHKTKCLMTNN